MINILGIRRIVILVAFLMLNAALVFLYYNVFSPQLVSKEQEKNGLLGQIGGVRNELNNIQIEFSLLEEQQKNFNKLEAIQFFDKQDRRRAQEILEVMQDRSSVLSAKASISGGALIDHPEAERAQHKILESSIQIEISAMEDTDIFRYLWLLENRFPGYVDIKTFTLERKVDVNRELLQKIISGEKPEIVSAKIAADWKTMIPASAAIGGGESGQQGVPR